MRIVGDGRVNGRVFIRHSNKIITLVTRYSAQELK